MPLSYLTEKKNPCVSGNDWYRNLIDHEPLIHLASSWSDELPFFITKGVLQNEEKWGSQLRFIKVFKVSIPLSNNKSMSLGSNGNKKGKYLELIPPWWKLADTWPGAHLLLRPKLASWQSEERHRHTLTHGLAEELVLPLQGDRISPHVQGHDCVPWQAETPSVYRLDWAPCHQNWEGPYGKDFC